jgi:hypothetical protein
MSEFTEWKEDQHFIGAEAIRVLTTIGDTLDAVVVTKAFWLNPPGVRSTRVGIDVPLLSEDQRTTEQRNLVVGWRCERCKTLLFAICISDLWHLPCCEGFRSSGSYEA